MTNLHERVYEPLKGFGNRFEITTEAPYFIRRVGTKEILDEWFNGYGEEAVLIDNELHLISDLIPK